ncbi:MAG TPA: lipoyl domain-containing protein [Phycisphaerae bacterium]|jgi:biotin carboxyl carrier protein|nr:lipoyl domain-containing protein [Phycisphaerae bacterium]
MMEQRLEFPDDGRSYQLELRVKAGDSVKPGDVLALIESDKATQELEAFEAMRIVAIRRVLRGYVLQTEKVEGL